MTSRRTVANALGRRPTFGPIPANQLLSWVLITLVAYLTSSFLSLTWFQGVGMWLWMLSTWLLLTGKHPWKFLARFVRHPHWRRGYRRYSSIHPR